LVGLAFRFADSEFSLGLEELEELHAGGETILKMEAELTEKNGQPPVYIFDTKVDDSYSMAFKDITHPGRNKHGSYIVELPSSYMQSIQQLIEQRVSEPAPEPEGHTPEEKFSLALSGYFHPESHRYMDEKHAAEFAGISVMAFKGRLKKAIRDSDLMREMLGRRWRGKLEARELLPVNQNRLKLIELIADDRMSGLSVCELAEKHKQPLGVITSILWDYQGRDWYKLKALYQKTHAGKGVNIGEKITVAFSYKYYAVGMREQFLEKHTDSQYQQSMKETEFSDGFSF